MHRATRAAARTARRGLATGRGTGFKLVTEHQAEVRQARHLRPRSAASALIDGIHDGDAAQGAGWPTSSSPTTRPMRCPTAITGGWFAPPNDAFLTANTHREGISLFDILQPAYAALYSGALHPTAEGHAVVADTMVKYAREVIDARAHPHIEVRPVTTGQR